MWCLAVTEPCKSGAACLKQAQHRAAPPTAAPTMSAAHAKAVRLWRGPAILRACASKGRTQGTADAAEPCRHGQVDQLEPLHWPSTPLALQLRCSAELLPTKTLSCVGAATVLTVAPSVELSVAGAAVAY